MINKYQKWIFKKYLFSEKIDIFIEKIIKRIIIIILLIIILYWITK